MHAPSPLTPLMGCRNVRFLASGTSVQKLPSLEWYNLNIAEQLQDVNNFSALMKKRSSKERKWSE